MNESPNPYEATFLEADAPPETIRFLNSEPQPTKITGVMIEESAWAVFWPRRWRFIGLGLLQAVLVGVPVIFFAIVEFLCKFFGFDFRPTHGSILEIVLAGLDFLAGLVFVFWTCLTCVVIGKCSLRLLRGEKLFHKPTMQSIFRLCVTGVNCICYALICYLMAVLAYVPLLGGIFALERQIIDTPLLKMLVGIVFAGFVAFCLFCLFIFGRYLIGLPYIVDRRVSCLTALRRTPGFARGNAMTIALSFLRHYFVLGVLSVITLGIAALAVPGYLYCWLAVTYLLATGQYEQPTESETTEW